MSEALAATARERAVNAGPMADQFAKPAPGKRGVVTGRHFPRSLRVILRHLTRTFHKGTSERTVLSNGPVSVLTFDTFQRTPAQTKPTATREPKRSSLTAESAENSKRDRRLGKRTPHLSGDAQRFPKFHSL